MTVINYPDIYDRAMARFGTHPSKVANRRIPSTPDEAALAEAAAVFICHSQCASVKATCPTALKRGFAARTVSCVVSSSRARPPAVYFPKTGSEERKPGFRLE
jgi:hypothetical protein